MKRSKFLCLALSGILLATTLSAIPLQVHAENRDETLAAQQAKSVETNGIPNWPDGPVVSADSAILIDAQTGAILYAKDVHKQQYPASTTKILTALIAAENCRMDEMVTFSHDSVFDMPSGSSHIAIEPGEELTMEQCLQAILIASANEVSFAVAEHIVQSDWEDFASIMNQRATELGCLNSNFVNPNGLPDDNHYTTAYDLAMIGQAFFANELLCKYASTTLLHIPPTDKQPDDIYAATTNDMLKGQKYYYEYVVAGKTGYTDAARSCLVTCAEKDGLRLICVVLHDYAPRQYEDTKALFEYGFANFQRWNVSQVEDSYDVDNSNFFYSENDIFGSSKPILALNTQAAITLPKTADFADVTSTLSYEDAQEGQVALISYYYQGQYVGDASIDLVATETSEYEFELASSEDLEEETQRSGGQVIFINILKVILWVVGIAGGFILLIILYAFVRNYHFSDGDSRSRRGWRRSRKKRRRRRRRVPPASQRKNRRPRSNGPRFRDYDD